MHLGAISTVAIPYAELVIANSLRPFIYLAQGSIYIPSSRFAEKHTLLLLSSLSSSHSIASAGLVSLQSKTHPGSSSRVSRRLRGR